MTLYKNGDLHIYRNMFAVNYITTSDARLKTDIRALEGVLPKIEALQPVHYRLIDSGIDGNNPERIGALAQDVEPLFPQLVTTDLNGNKYLSYGEMSVVAIQGIREQQTIIRNLETRVTALENENAELRATLTRQQTLLDSLVTKLATLESLINKNPN
jgi:hypothetical protein